MSPEAKIQLLELLPHNGDNDAPIRCGIKTAHLIDEPEYDALSYVWGDVSFHPVNVDVDGQSVPVTRNLHSVLRRLRLADSVRTLWIDQLCINQDDNKEKAIQVQLMRDIYSGCRACVLWMGEVPEDIPVADAQAVLGLLEYMAAVYETRDSGRVPPSEILAADPKFKGPAKAMRRLLGEDGFSKEASWWKRIWTVQEAALPRQLVLMWGPLSMPWDKMVHATRCWTTGIPHDVGVLMGSPYDPPVGSLMANAIWLEVAKSRNENPLWLVFRWRHRCATDPRDKVYGLLGLCDRGTMPTVEICDYDLPPSRLFCSLTTDLILHDESLLPLVADPRLEAEKATPGVARWAFDAKEISTYNTDWHPIYGYDQYNACGDREMDFEAFKQRMQDEPEVLQIPGARADKIAHVGKPLIQDKVVAGPIDETYYIERLNEWREFGAKYHPQKHTFWEDFGRTLLGDLIRNHEQWVERRATTTDVHEVYEYLVDSGGDSVRRTVRGMVANQVFFVTETGLLGLGHMDTKPGDEVWVLDEGKMPFTLTPRKGGEGEEVDYDFGGKCYVHGLMSGQLFYWDDEAPPSTMLRIH